MEYVNHIRNALDLYDLMLDNGVAREQARIVLPVSLYTTFYAKVDAHNLMHFLRLRLHGHTQKETREYAKALLIHMEKVIPWTTELFIEELRASNYEV
jgi:thymidylate synthase (FAD)